MTLAVFSFHQLVSQDQAKSMVRQGGCVPWWAVLHFLQPDPGKEGPSPEFTMFHFNYKGYVYDCPARHPQQCASHVNSQVWKQLVTQCLLSSLSSAAPPRSTASLCGITTMGQRKLSRIFGIYCLLCTPAVNFYLTLLMINRSTLLTPVQWYRREEGADKTRWTQQDLFHISVSTLLVFPQIVVIFYLCYCLGSKGIYMLCKKSQNVSKGIKKWLLLKRILHKMK